MVIVSCKVHYLVNHGCEYVIIVSFECCENILWRVLSSPLESVVVKLLKKLCFYLIIDLRYTIVLLKKMVGFSSEIL